MEPIVPITLINVVKVALWLGLGQWAWRLARAYNRAKTSAARGENSLESGTWLFQQKLQIAGFILALVVLTGITQSEFAYRPKNALPVSNPTIERQMQELENTEFSLKPSQSDAKDRSFTRDYQEKNRSQNLKARQAFEDLDNKAVPQ